MQKKVQKISTVLIKTLSARGLAGRVKEYRVLGRWEKIAGKVIARHAQPISLQGKKVTIAVDSSAWMQQLSLLKSELIEKFNLSLGPDAVRSIVFRIGEIAEAAGPRVEPPIAARLDDAERQAIETYTQNIHDAEVKILLKRLIEKDMINKKQGTRGGPGRKT